MQRIENNCSVPQTLIGITVAATANPHSFPDWEVG